MGLADRISAFVTGRELATRDDPEPPSTPDFSRTPQAVPYLSSTTAIGLSSVHRCVTLIADQISRGERQEWVGLNQVDASRLVRRPSALMSPREWTWRVVATEALHNVVYLLHTGGYDDQGRPWSLLPLPPAAVIAGPTDPWGILPPTWYRVAGRRVEATDMTIIRRAPWPGVSEGLSGVLELARREFSAYLAADTHLSRYWQAGGPPITVISTDQELINDDADVIAQRWADRRTMGADFPVVMGKGAHAEPYGGDPTTDSATKARQEMVADVGRYFGVPTRILNAPTAASETYANREDEATDLDQFTLDGYVAPIEDAITTHLSPGYLDTRRMVIDMSHVTQGSLAARATAYSALVGGRILERDEARARGFGLPPLDSKDTTPAVADGAATTASEVAV